MGFAPIGLIYTQMAICASGEQINRIKAAIKHAIAERIPTTQLHTVITNVNPHSHNNRK